MPPSLLFCFHPVLFLVYPSQFFLDILRIRMRTAGWVRFLLKKNKKPQIGPLDSKKLRNELAN